TNKSTTNTNSDKVFIVHGHDDAAKIKTARFVEQLDYKAIILHGAWGRAWAVCGAGVWANLTVG
ncbi:nucleotide-binding protein, partial [Salmonella enterica subsp. enterica serovar Kentucky]|nr:nucleotide-binding protein [Salmonella enterica subsp. enterica serovar Kentucky]